MEKATFAGGCFWAMEDAFSGLAGVTQTQVGYMGGHAVNPTHTQVRTGKTGHAEVVDIVFDNALISFEDLLKTFFNAHDPTQYNRQGPDVGPEFRSAVFYHSPQQQHLAAQMRSVHNKIKGFPRPIMTEITAASTFYPADEMHQHFLAKERARHHPWHPPIAEALAERKGLHLR